MQTSPESSHLENPEVALIVAAYNAASILPRCLESLLKQNPDQIIVVNDGSTDSTKAVLDSLDQVKAVHLDQNAGIGNARNRGLEVVDSHIEYIAFIDSDIILEEGWLSTLLKEVDWKTYSAACGRIRAADAGEHWAATLDEAQTSQRFASEPRKLDPPWREVMYFNYLFKAEVFQKVGEFDPRFRTNAEDSDYFYRCAAKGLCFLYQPKATGLHCYPKPTFGGWIKRTFRSGFYTVQFHLKNKTPLRSQKLMKVCILLLALLVLLAVPFVLSELWPIGVYLVIFLGVGVMKGFQLEWQPFLGGWISILGWLAKGTGEVWGILRGRPIG